MLEELKEQVNQLPSLPGVYRYYSIENELIYVGKAKNLKNRVSSYFVQTTQHSPKTKRLVRLIHHLKYTVVNSEFDALLLENSFIKKYQPRYNILLKDDKTYPYIKIVNEDFPRIISTRQVIPGTGEYFGPFSNVKALNNLIELLHKLFNIRTCSLSLSDNNITQGKYDVCLEYHIGNCKAPCTKKQTSKEYLENIAYAKNILKGNLSPAKEYYKTEMSKFADEFSFEKAQEIKEKLDLLLSFESKSIVANPKLNNIDVISLVTLENECYINYLRLQYGIITASKNLRLSKKLEENNEDILLTLAALLHEELNSEAKEIITNIDINSINSKYTLTNPKIGDKRKLVELSLQNALIEKNQKIKAESKKINPSDRLLIEAKKELRLTELPRHIECFDNSNIQGSNPVASMVCFKNGKPSKKDYRHFNIKTVEGPNDFDSMYEIVYRRYKRLSDENEPMPNLVLIDGGKGQLSAALKAVKDLQLVSKLPLIGIAKRLEELYFPGDQIPLFLSKKSETLRLLQQLRNEAHRFAITFHRQKRSINFIQSELSTIPGIGQKTEQLLLEKYKSFDNIKKASQEDLENLIGSKRSTLLLHYFKK